MPMNVRISRESLLHSRSTVQWLVSSISYDQEYYVVQYGLSESNLNMSSSPITSGPNITRVNFLLSVELSDLMVGTTYYYRVTASNSAGTNSSTITSSFNMTSNHEECMAMLRNLLLKLFILIQQRKKPCTKYVYIKVKVVTTKLKFISQFNMWAA